MIPENSRNGSSLRPICADFTYQGVESYRDVLLQAAGRWPKAALKDVQDMLTRSIESAAEQAKDEVQVAIEERRSELLAIIKYLQEMRNDHKLWRRLDPATKATLSLPLRLKNRMKGLIGRFNESLVDNPEASESSQALAKFTREWTSSEIAKIVASKDGFFDRIIKALWESKDVEVVPKFRECIADPLAEASRTWFEAVETVFSLVENMYLERRIDEFESRSSIRQSCEKDELDIVSGAFNELVLSYRDQHEEGLTVTVCPEPAINQLKVVKLVPSDGENYSAVLLGTHRLLPGAKLLKAFTIESRCVIVVTTTSERTIVERVDFPAVRSSVTGNVS